MLAAAAQIASKQLCECGNKIGAIGPFANIPETNLPSRRADDEPDYRHRPNRDRRDRRLLESAARRFVRAFYVAGFSGQGSF